MFVILIAVMILRPSGLLGARRGAEGLSERRRPRHPADPASRGSASTSGSPRTRAGASGAAGVAGRSASGSSSSRTLRSSPRSASPRRSLPLLTSNGYVIRVGFDTLIYMLLALGLNIVVGFAGLLDLGYVAFFGFGAYVYAMLASTSSACTGRRRRS